MRTYSFRDEVLNVLVHQQPMTHEIGRADNSAKDHDEREWNAGGCKAHDWNEHEKAQAQKSM
jgi:hypothetical protein